MSAGAAIARGKDLSRAERGRETHAAPAIIEKLRCQRCAFVCVEGRSMWPSIRPRDIVFVQRAEMNQVTAGQIVAFARENRLIIHRVVSEARKDGDGGLETFLMTKGDALDTGDYPVSREELLGRVTRIHRGRRHIDLESLTHRALGRIAAQVSPFSRWLFVPARRIRDLLRSLPLRN